MKSTLDVLIVTAVDIEYHAVLQVDDGAVDSCPWTNHRTPSGHEYSIREFNSGDQSGSPLRFAVIQALSMGGNEAISAATQIMKDHDVRCLAMCGVCAGRRGDTSLGDVVVADRMWEYDYGKVKAELQKDGTRKSIEFGDTEMFRIKPPTWKQDAERFKINEDAAWLKTRPISYEHQGNWVLERLIQGDVPANYPSRAASCPNYPKVLDYLRKRKYLKRSTVELSALGRRHIQSLIDKYPDGLLSPSKLRVHVGPVASGNKVVEDPTIFGRLSSSNRKVLALEMEAAAIGQFAHNQSISHLIVAKAVMDHADEHKSDNFKDFAARAAAEWLISFVRHHLHPMTGGSNRLPDGDRHTTCNVPESKAKVHTVSDVALGAVVPSSPPPESAFCFTPFRASDPRYLVGRDSLLASIRTNISKGQSVFLCGGPKVGKTSLLKKLMLGYESDDSQEGHSGTKEQLIVGYLCSHELETSDGPGDFWRLLLNDTRTKGERLQVWNAIEAAIVEGRQDSIRNLLRRLKAKNVKLVLVLDELEALVGHKSFPASFFNQLRTWSEKPGNVVSVMASRKRKHNLEQRLQVEKEQDGSTALNLADERLLGTLNKDAVEHLLALGGISEGNVRHLAWQLTGGHPHLLHLFGEWWLEHRGRSPGLLLERINAWGHDLWNGSDGPVTRGLLIAQMLHCMGASALPDSLSWQQGRVRDSARHVGLVQDVMEKASDSPFPYLLAGWLLDRRLWAGGEYDATGERMRPSPSGAVRVTDSTSRKESLLALEEGGFLALGEADLLSSKLPGMAKMSATQLLEQKVRSVAELGAQ